MSYASVTSTSAIKWFISQLFLLKLVFIPKNWALFALQNPKKINVPPVIRAIRVWGLLDTQTMHDIRKSFHPRLTRLSRPSVIST